MKYVLEFMIALAIFLGIASATVYVLLRSLKGLRGRFGPGRWKVEVTTVKRNGRMYQAEHFCVVNLHKRGAVVTVGEIKVDDPEFEDKLIELESQAHSRAATLNAVR